MLSQDHLQRIIELTDAVSIRSSETIQTLWSGYGQIVRVRLDGGNTESVIAKVVMPPITAQQPRGWNTNQSHQRKLRSYVVESYWYQHYGNCLDDDCRVANCYLVESEQNQHLFVLEDLDQSGYVVRHSRLNAAGVQLGLAWLANFHAKFLGCPPDGLWPIGTYWHLDTRPDELEAISEPHPLKLMASRIDQMLSRCTFQTLVHGDAKVANFCFSSDGRKVAAVDFQYVGGGCGMKDVAYFLGSCLNEDECEADASKHLDHYFKHLRAAAELSFDDVPTDQLEAEWRSLYPVAWADFHRFLIGWCPGHHKLHGYTKRMTERAMNLIKSN